MRRVYEAWKDLEVNPVVETTEMENSGLLALPTNSVVETTELQKPITKPLTIRGLRLTHDEDFPLTAFLNLSFTHHVAIFRYAKDYDERKYYIQTGLSATNEGRRFGEHYQNKCL